MSQAPKDLLLKIQELEMEIKKLKKQKKYGLVWEDKPEQIIEDCKENVPILRLKEKKKGIDPIIYTDPNKNESLLIEGDNYHSLTVLNYTHKDKIDFIYADPPYNTGAKDWRYNNDYVDSEDPYRHTKWISFMSKRLELARNLLKDDGVICVTIDDYEMPRLWLLMEGIFGADNHLGTVAIRINPKGRMTNKKVSLVHEYAIFFGKSSKSKIQKAPENPEDKTHSYIQDKDGTWYLPVNLRKQGVDSLAINKKGNLSDRFFPIYINSKTGEISVTKKFDLELYPIDQNGEKRIWRRGKDVIEEMFASRNLWFKQTKQGPQVYFKFTGGLEGRMIQSLWLDTKFSASEYGTKDLDEILGKREVFQYPKSQHAVIESIIAGTSNTNAIVLDFFAGSGTTGHAVLDLNKQDGGNRTFILCTNNENNICEEVTYERVKRIIKGYKDKKGEIVPGYSGNLRYYKTELINIEKLYQTPDQAKIKLTYEAGEMIGLKENTLNEVEKNQWWQIFEGQEKATAIYFKEDKEKLSELVSLIEKKKIPTALYIFSWGKNEYKNEYSSKIVRVEDIPEPILEVYKEINKL
jgi:adenine-specific DNA-methyltransferase